MFTESVFDLHLLEKLSEEKRKDVDLHIGTEMLNLDDELLKQYNKEFLIMQVNQYIRDAIMSEKPKKKVAKRKPKVPENSEEENAVE